jgi:large subunit ribosomal protein L2
MGKKIRVQRRGRGTSTFRASTHKRIAPVKYPQMTKQELDTVIQGSITEIMHEPGRGAPFAEIKLESGETWHTVMPEGVYQGQQIQVGGNATIDIGNVLPIGKISEGTLICNIEISPNDGGKLARSSGAYATIVSHTPEGTIIKLPSGKSRYINPMCRATVGVIAGAGRVDRPFLKAGPRAHLMEAKGRVYPRTRGVAMVAAAHPYGSSKRGGRRVTTVSRNAPPGQKVGLIAARSTGRGRKRVKT